MRCLHPVATSRGILFPCGKCPACLSERREELAERIFFESRVSPSSYFVTLTYDNEHLPIDKQLHINCFDKQEIQTYIRRVRDFLRPRNVSLRYFLTCEFGDASLRSHYHAVVYFSTFLSLQQAWILFNELWQKGIVYLSSVGAGCCKYVAKYCLKDDGIESYSLPSSSPSKPFRLFSRRPGIGCTDECVQYWYDRFQLHKNYFDFDSVNMYSSGEKFIPRIPRVVRNKFDEFTQAKITQVGWSKFYALQEDLGKALNDPALNRCLDPVKNEWEPILDQDLEIKKKARKLRQLKKNCL